MNLGIQNGRPGNALRHGCAVAGILLWAGMAAAATDTPVPERKSGPTAQADEQPGDFKSKSNAIAKENVEARKKKLATPRDGNINDSVWGTRNRNPVAEGAKQTEPADGGSATGTAGTR